MDADGAIAQIVTMPGGTAEVYDAVFAALHPDGRYPDGQIGHIAGPGPDGFVVIDVWESRAAYETFAAEVLGPVLATAGVPPIAAIEFPVHNLQRSVRVA